MVPIAKVGEGIVDQRKLQNSKEKKVDLTMYTAAIKHVKV